MFDDQDDVVGGGVTPTNLPVAEPDDMFGGTDPLPSASTPASQSNPSVPSLSALPPLPSFPDNTKAGAASPAPKLSVPPIEPLPPVSAMPSSKKDTGLTNTLPPLPNFSSAPSASPIPAMAPSSVSSLPAPGEVPVPIHASDDVEVVQPPLSGVNPLDQTETVPVVPSSASPSALGAGVLRPAGSPETPSLGHTPAPLDPFDALDPTSNTVSAAIPQKGASFTQPTPVPTQDAQFAAPMPAPGAGNAYALKEPTLSRGLMSLIIVGVVLFVFGGGALFIYRAVIQDDSNSAPVVETTEQEESVQEESQDDESFRLGGAQGEDRSLEEREEELLLFGEPVDADGDGISDDDELRLGTDPSNWDSDNDQLSDGDEVIIWNTDPANPDSDGDTYLDGEEVKNGYSPTGPGRLFDVDALASETSSSSVDEITEELALPLEGDVSSTIAEEEPTLVSSSPVVASTGNGESNVVIVE